MRISERGVRNEKKKLNGANGMSDIEGEVTKGREKLKGGAFELLVIGYSWKKDDSNEDRCPTIQKPKR